MRTPILASAIALLGLTSTAEAHFILMSPAQTSNDTVGGKGNPPCGPDTNDVTTPTAAQGGHPLMIKLNEFVPHDGFYRVALALNSRSAIPVDNVVYDKNGKVLPPNNMPTGTSDHADYENPAVFPVLADNLFPHSGTAAMTFMGSVMLPNVNCDRCILQVIEFMHPHGFNTSTPGPGGGYFYHHCAELKITADPSMPLFTPAGDGGVTDASQSADGSGGAPATGTGGSAGTAGASGGAGSSPSGTGGASSAGTGGEGGSVSTSGNGGSIGSGGTPGSAGSGMPLAGAGGSGMTTRSSGGGCSISAKASPSAGLLLVALFSVLIARRRNSKH